MKAYINNNVVTIEYQTDIGRQFVDRELHVPFTTDADGIVTVKLTQECLYDLLDLINQGESK